MPTASPMSATSPRRSARRRAAITKPRTRLPMTARNGLPFPTRSSACMFANRTSWFKDGRLRPRQVPADLGRIPRRRQTAQSQAAALRADPRPRLWRRAGVLVSLFVVVGRQGGRGRRQNRGARTARKRSKSVKFAVAMWNECYDSGALSWDDAGNNRAFLSNTISSTNNGASIYLLARSKPDTYVTETGKPIKDDCFHAPLPKGPAGQFSYHVPFSNIVPAYTREPKGREGISALVPVQGHLRAVVHLAAGLLGRQHQDVGERPGVEDRPGDGAVPHRGGKRPFCRLRWAVPAEPRPRRSPNSSSSTCIQKPFRAWRPRTRSNGRMANW